MINNILEKVLLPAFILVNIILYYFSKDNASFVEGADASQYIYPALSFIKSGNFLSSSGDLLTFGPPLYSMFLAIPISIFGLNESTIIIVIMQCTLLYLTGFLSKYLLLQFSSRFSVLLQALIVFNPNSLITAHLIQSETLFTFLLVWSVVVIFKIITDFSWINIILLGILIGLAALARPIALYLLILYPVFILTILIIKGKPNINNVAVFHRNGFWIKLLAIGLIGGLVVSPWYIRNYTKFDKVFFSSNSGAYLQSQYIQLKNQGSGWSVADAMKEHKIKFSNYLTKERRNNFCLDNDRHWSCNSLLTHVSLRAIINEPLVVHIKAFTHSWGTLFFSGGASNIRNYLGFDGKDLIVNFQNNPFNGLESIVKLVKDMNFSYLFIFIFTTTFSIVSRITGIIGVFYLLKNKKWRPYGVLLIEIVVFFTAAYLYLGQSRFRVPIEPVLMLFSVIGILYMVKARKMDS
jgi:hypothetical protein